MFVVVVQLILPSLFSIDIMLHVMWFSLRLFFHFPSNKSTAIGQQCLEQSYGSCTTGDFIFHINIFHTSKRICCLQLRELRFIHFIV